MQDQSDACRQTGLCQTCGKGATAHHALESIDLGIHVNSFVTQFRPSGCGKATLLRLIARFDQPTRGEVANFGRIVAGLPSEDRPGTAR